MSTNMAVFVAAPPPTIQGNMFQFEVNINLPEDKIADLERTVSATRGAKGEIIAPFRAKSYFQIDNPSVFPLTRSGGTPLSPDIIEQMNRYEFYSAHLYCTFMPAKGCRFSDAQFEVALTTIPAAYNTPPTPVEDAIAYDLYPQKVEDSCNISRTYGITPELSFNFGPGIAFEAEKVKNFIAYSNRIFAYGLHSSNPGWQFKRTYAHEIEGIQELFMLIRKPRFSQVNARFSLTARLEVITGAGQFGPFTLSLFVRGKDSTIVDEPVISLC